VGTGLAYKSVAMVLVSLVFLFVYLFGAYAYGAATVYGVRELSPVWRHHAGDAPDPRADGHRIDVAPLALFSISTVWFILHTLIEFRNLTGDTRQGWLDIGTFIVFLFPPVIMHVVYLESFTSGAGPRPPRIFRQLLGAMYVVSTVIGLLIIAAIFEVIAVPGDIGPWIGISIGSLFMLASLYSTTLLLRRERPSRTPDQQRLRNVMIFLFIMLSSVFIALIFMQEQRLLVEILDKVSRSSPIYFLIASVYFENRFEFYDLVVKRAVLILLSVLVLGVFLAATLPWLEELPVGMARAWLFAVALAPVAMVMPWLHARMEHWLDRIWLGREFTPVDAVKHVLAAMQPATDERSLIEAAQARLSEIFGARIAVLAGPQAPDGAIEIEVAMPTPLSGEPVRIVVLKDAGMRRILSEDLKMLRSLAGVLGFMLENIRLQRRRQEQDQVAQELRLQSSKSELKALRAQINPHFLFNALNAIASLIHTDPGRADEAVEQLAEVFRYTLKRSESEWAPLDQELTFARAYLDVERARFGQRLTCSIDSDHPSPPPHVPSMLLQTLLENAVKHGVSQAREAGRIEVIVRTTSGEVTLEVRNTGPGADAAGLGQRDGEGFGLHSVRERLKGHFGDGASFALTRDEAAGVTIARITMPHVRMAA
jgi:signal transduction histidine kinase